MSINALKIVSYDKIIISGSFYSPPEVSVIKKYMEKNNVEYIQHYSSVGIDNYVEWLNEFNSEYLFYKEVKENYNYDDEDTDDFNNDYNKDDRVIIIEENMELHTIFFHLNEMQIKKEFMYKIYEKINDDGSKHLIIRVLYWWTL